MTYLKKKNNMNVVVVQEAIVVVVEVTDSKLAMLIVNDLWMPPKPATNTKQSRASLT